MAKRLVDTEIWKMAWFRKLSPKLKSVFKYICDNCDHAGIWEIDLEILSMHVNDRDAAGNLQQVSQDEIVWAFQEKVQLIGADKMFIESFVLFQYKLKSISDLNPQNKVHRSVIERLEKYSISNISLAKPLAGGAKDKEKDQDKEKEKEQLGLFDFDSVYQAHPVQGGREKGIEALRKDVRSQSDFADLLEAHKNFRRTMKTRDEKFIPGFLAFAKSWRDFRPKLLAIQSPPAPEPARSDTPLSEIVATIDPAKIHPNLRGVFGVTRPAEVS